MENDFQCVLKLSGKHPGACDIECTACKEYFNPHAVSPPPDQPVPEEVKATPLINKIVAVLRQKLEAFGDKDNGIRIFGRTEAAYNIEKILQDETAALQTRLSSTEAERDAIRKAFDLQAEELKKYRNQPPQ